MVSAGVDAIELQGVSGYLIDQFMTSAWNHRTDKYGGSLEQRLRFPIEIIEAIKKAAGPDYPVIFRFSIFHDMPQGRDMEEGLEVSRILENAGV
jgi:2-enoate reductase